MGLMDVNAVVEGKFGGRDRAVGTFITEVPLVPAVRIAIAAGADFLVFDCEHGVIELRELRAAIAICRAARVRAFVRIPQIETHWIAEALDSGASGIVAPNVETVAEATRLIEQAFYPPVGRRGASFGSAQDGYSGGDIAGKVSRANRETIVLCMIESPKGLSNVEAMAALPEIAGCWFGYIDFSIAAGHPGQIDYHDVLLAADRIADACIQRGKIAGVMTTSLEHLQEYVRRRYNLVAWGSDVFVLKQGFSAGIQTCRAALQTYSPETETINDQTK